MGCGDNRGKRDMQRASWMPEPPKALTVEMYRNATEIADVDSQMWDYLCALIPETGADYTSRTRNMLSTLTPELRRYYLVRQFDWLRGGDGLEFCFMEAHAIFLDETLAAFESLGAKPQADIIRQLLPLAKERAKRIAEADAKGAEFNFDDGFWEPWEQKYDAAADSFDFVGAIWNDIVAHPERYAHPPGIAEDKVVPNAKMDSVRVFFATFTKLGNNFNPAVADMYADDAKIQNKRIFPDGRIREMAVVAPQYKQMLREIMPLAKIRGDTDSFTNTTFTAEGIGVRIKTTRHSNLKNYDSPYEILVSPSANGTWLIREEISESRP
jgi:hypothetical protein